MRLMNGGVGGVERMRLYREYQIWNLGNLS